MTQFTFTWQKSSSNGRICNAKISVCQLLGGMLKETRQATLVQCNLV
uniref:Uncharacterized protein n=1 Tax=Salix viminalis TaxID=40686 RepID=A0A6N2L256_SALVM